MSHLPEHFRARRPLRARRGLTLAELILGLAMLGIVMMAAAGLMAAVAAGWKSGDASARTASVSERAGFRLEESLTNAFHVFQTDWVNNSGGGNGNAQTGVFFWSRDDVTGVADGKAQFGEAALVVFDKNAKAVLLYEAIPRASMTSAQRTAAEQSSWGDPADPLVVSYWRSQSFVAAPKTLIGGQSGASEVTAATFKYFAASGAKPVVAYDLTMTQGGLPVSRQGTVTLRVAQKPRNIS